MSPELDIDKLIENPQRFSTDKVVSVIPVLTESQRMKLKLRVKELLQEETSLPFSERNQIFVSNYEKILKAITDEFRGKTTKGNKKSKKKENDENRRKILYKTRFSYDGCHYCEFSDDGRLSFLKYKNGQSETVSSVKIPDPDAEDSEITILPAPQIAQTKRDRALKEDRNEAVKFPPGPIDYESEYALYCEIKAFIHAFMELKPEIGEVLRAQILRNAQVAAETPNGIIANEVLTLMDSLEATEKYTVGGKSYTGIYMSAIYEELGKDYAKQTGKILSALGLKTDRPRITKTRKGPNGEPQEYTKRYSVVRIPDEKKVTELRSRYDPDFVIAKLSSIEQGRQALLDDEDYEDDEKGRGTLNFNAKSDNNPEFSEPSEQNKSLDFNDSLQKDESFQSNKDIEKEKNSEKNINKNAYRSPKTEDTQAREHEKTDTPLKNDSPHRPLSPALQEEHVNSYVQSKKPYKSVGVVLKALEDWGLEVLEYDHLLFAHGKWKAKLKGRFDSLTTEQQEFLAAGFELHFKGSPSADFTWVHFEVIQSD